MPGFAEKMSRQSRKTIVVLLVIAALIGASVWFCLKITPGIRVGTAVVSQTLCSGVFVSGLDPDQLYVETVRPIPGQDLLAKRLVRLGWTHSDGFDMNGLLRLISDTKAALNNP